VLVTSPSTGRCCCGRTFFLPAAAVDAAFEALLLVLASWSIESGDSFCSGAPWLPPVCLSRVRPG
jgi:hypothetical protein